MIGTKTEVHVRRKLKESIFQDLHAAIKASNDTKVDGNNEIMEVSFALKSKWRFVINYHLCIADWLGRRDDDEWRTHKSREA